MKPIVIDASVAGAWVLPDEPSEAAQALYREALKQHDLFHAPSLWTWEVGNILAMAAVRGRIEPGQADLGLELLGAAHVNLDPPLAAPRQAQVLRLAQAHGLTFYDAGYLELVLRHNGQLASLDRQLVSAAMACGIVCLKF